MIGPSRPTHSSGVGILTIALLPFLLLATAACSKHRIAADADVASYRYVLVNDIGDTRNLALDLEDMFAEMGFTPIGPERYQRLAPGELAHTLLFRMNANCRNVGADVGLRLIDAANGRVVYAGQGSSFLGLGERHDILLAARQALSGLEERRGKPAQVQDSP